MITSLQFSLFLSSDIEIFFIKSLSNSSSIDSLDSKILSKKYFKCRFIFLTSSRFDFEGLHTCTILIFFSYEKKLSITSSGGLLNIHSYVIIPTAHISKLALNVF